jgi:hypothetical protein
MLAYKTLEIDANLDFRLVEFFIKGTLMTTGYKSKTSGKNSTNQTE